MLRYRLKNWYYNAREKVCIKLAWALPRRLVYWCSIRLMARATQGEWSKQVVPELTAMDALKRWGVK